MDIKLTDYQTHIIRVLRYVTEFFEKNGIRYYLAYGTMLGAVRHKGIIPWDDDADVFVPREDYERLLKLRGQLIEGGYDVFSMESEGGYLSYAKIYDNHTSLWEVKQFPKIIGVFVDVFPLDYADSSFDCVVEKVKRFSVLSRKFSLSNSLYSFQDAFCFLKEFHLKTAWIVLKSFLYRRVKARCFNELKKYYRSLHRTGGKYLVDYSSSVNVIDPRSVIYESAWFEDYVMMQFCDFQARVPIGYDEYLKCRYGNYMEFPPESEREPQHSHFYLNLHEHESIEDVKKKIIKKS